MSLAKRIERLNFEANQLLREKKSDTLVLVIPNEDGKGWIIDGCHNYKTGKENTALKQRLEACNTFEELINELDGYATNIPNVRRSHEFE